MSLPLFYPLVRHLGRQTPVTVPVQTDFLRWLGLLSLATFVGYLVIGLPLPVLSLFVRHELGLSDALAGLAVGISFLATVLTRGFAGNVADGAGPQVAFKSGLIYAVIGGLIYLAAALSNAHPWTRYAILIAGRLVFGVGESLLITGVLAWGVALAGPQRSGKVMAWIGMAMYGSLAAGAPLGLALSGQGGFTALAVSVILVPLVALAIAATVPPVAPAAHHARRRGFLSVLGSIWRPGVALALQGVGFAAIGAFATLYFTAESWGHAGLALSAFGGAFVLARILFGNLPDRAGGLRIAVWFFAIELAGQALMTFAHAPVIAFLGAGLTGFGCSMIFPALGSVVVRQVPAPTRGTALGAYAAFQDVAYGATGPLTGLLAGIYGYRVVFACGTVCALLGLALAWHLRRQDANRA